MAFFHTDEDDEDRDLWSDNWLDEAGDEEDEYDSPDEEDDVDPIDEDFEDPEDEDKDSFDGGGFEEVDEEDE